MANFKEKSTPVGIRQGTGKSVGNPTDRLSPISLGKKERELLTYLFHHQKERFNIAGYSKHFGWKRSTIYDYLNLLIRKELVDASQYGDKRISQKGIVAVQVSDGGVETARRDCRDGVNLSKHDSRFTVPILDKRKFDCADKSLLADRLGAYSYKPVVLPNRTDHIFRFSDATIIVKMHIAVIRIHDIVAEDTDEASYQSIVHATEYADKLCGVGIDSETLIVENAHYARVSSFLAEFLEKIDNKYYLDLGNGRKFWIDRSHTEAPEDETNDEQVRERLDKHLTSMSNTDETVGEVSSNLVELKNIVSDLVKVNVLTAQTAGKTTDHVAILTDGLRILTSTTNSFFSLMNKNNAQENQEMKLEKVSYIG